MHTTQGSVSTYSTGMLETLSCLHAALVHASRTLPIDKKKSAHALRSCMLTRMQIVQPLLNVDTAGDQQKMLTTLRWRGVAHVRTAHARPHARVGHALSVAALDHVLHVGENVLCASFSLSLIHI